jgi:predicted ATPase/DNA-binding CsgD family transcriptional regulator
LRDLGRPEHVFSMAHPELPVAPVELQSLDALPNNLPGQLTSFVGRDAELGELAEALALTRLMTLTGAGGAGKTRLALQLAADTLERFDDGTWWLDLAPLSDPLGVGEALLAALGLRTSVGLTQLQVASAHLGSREALLLFDNCEHLLEEIAAIAGTLLESCPRVTILATSRAPLGLPGETTWRVPSLSLPKDEPQREPIAALAQSEAVRLFIERARKVRPNFAVSNENAPAVAEICQELDGIPLALELAAARVRMLTVEQIAAGLGDRFRLLTGATRTALPRQQTLRASVDWSHELLSELERVVLRRLGVFAGGFTLDVAERVASGDGVDRYAVLELLTSLVDKSLVMVEERGAAARYRLLETVRHYALDRLAEAGEAALVRDRHRDAFLELAEHAAPELGRAQQSTWLELLDAESANLAAALGRACATQPELALRLTIALTGWWRLRGRFTEADAAYALALTGPDVDVGLRARATAGRCFAAAIAGSVDAAAYGAEALRLADEAGDAGTAALALAAIGTAEMFANPRSARAHLERAISHARAADDEPTEVYAAQVLATVYSLGGDFRASQRLLAELEPLEQRVGNPQQVGYRAWLLGFNAHFEGRHEHAAACYARARAVAQEVGDPPLQALVDADSGLLEMQRGDGEAALARLRQRLEGILTEGAGVAWPWLIVCTGLVELACGHLAEARDRLQGLIEVVGKLDPLDVGLAYAGLAHAQRLLGDPRAADAAARRALELGESLGSSLLVGESRLALARLAAARGEWHTAEQHAHALLDACAEQGSLQIAPNTLNALAEIAAGNGSHGEAVGLLAAAARAMRDMGVKATWVGDDDRWPALADEWRNTLGQRAFDAAWAAGNELDLQQAIAWARRARGQRKRPQVGWEALTPTEHRVVELTAQGLTNPQIGAQMFITRATVKTHLERIYAKLGVHSRAELSAEASRHAPTA